MAFFVMARRKIISRHSKKEYNILIAALSIVILLMQKEVCRVAKPDKSLDPKILTAAKEEFLEKGYEKASTNVICKKAGVTWGALKNR